MMKLSVASCQLPVRSSFPRKRESSFRLFWIPAFAGMTLLAACAKPTAMTPHASQAEIAQERQQQSYMADAQVTSQYEGKSFTQDDISAMRDRLKGVIDKLAPEATKLCRELNGSQANCDMRVILSTKSKGLNAHADGTQIVMNADMVEFAKNDNQLAFILAHEYSHHMMRHVQSTQNNVVGGALLGTLLDALASSQGINTQGQIGKIGAQTALLSYSPEFENEADYIGLYIVARAGFKVEDAPQFWRQMAKVNKQGIYTRTTHPTTPERFVTMNKTIAEIEQKKAGKQRLLPNIRKSD